MRQYTYTLRHHDVDRNGGFRDVIGSTILLESIVKIDPVFCDFEETPHVHKIRIFMKDMPKPIIIGFVDAASAEAAQKHLVDAWGMALQ